MCVHVCCTRCVSAYVVVCVSTCLWCVRGGVCEYVPVCAFMCAALGMLVCME